VRTAAGVRDGGAGGAGSARGTKASGPSVSFTVNRRAGARRILGLGRALALAQQRTLREAGGDGHVATRVASSRARARGGGVVAVNP
jgi:hypothetical protein